MGVFYEELKEDTNSENFSYCESKFNKFLNNLMEYIPRNIRNMDKETEYLRKKLIHFNPMKAIIIGAIGLSVAFFPQALSSLLFGNINITQILQALNNNEKINWGNFFLKFGQGCLEGYTLKAKLPGKIISNVAISPIIESINAKIDGKDYNIKYSTIILKDSLKSSFFTF